jgi:flavin reductase (DIM6/NTAB) family NADH-FMN oxidoreductase RutF
MVKETDCCGLVSGAKTDKMKDWNPTVFYGVLKSAPLVEQCTVKMECEVLDILNVGSHSLVVGKIV